MMKASSEVKLVSKSAGTQNSAGRHDLVSLDESETVEAGTRLG